MTPHATSWKLHVGLYAACTLALLAVAGLVLWLAPVAETDPRSAHVPATRRGLSGGSEDTPHSSLAPEPDALWDAERADALVLRGYGVRRDGSQR